MNRPVKGAGRARGTGDRQTDASRLDRYRDALAHIPAPGDGCHAALLGVANHGVRAGVPDEQLAAEMRAHIPPGRRSVGPREVRDAVAKARADCSQSPKSGLRFWRPTPSSRVPVLDTDKAVQRLIEAGGGEVHELAILDPSPPARLAMKIDWPPEEDSWRLLAALYHPDAKLFIGSRYSAGPQHVRRAGDWARHLQRLAGHPDKVRGAAEAHSLIIPNPLSGHAALTKAGKQSWRCDACVQQFRFAVIEHDGLPKGQQLALLRALRLPVVALVDSGGRSYHAWVRVDTSGPQEWESLVEGELFPLLSQLGFDGACKNEARMSRLPGVLRPETGKWQRLVYLNPEGGALP